jgi:hypothetical protein
MKPICRWSSIAAVALAFAGCSGTSPECRIGADCASGACSRDGVCIAALHDDAGTNPNTGPGVPLDAGSAMPPPDAGSMPPIDATTNPGMDASNPQNPDATTMMPDGGTPSCLPNNDDTIERAEVPVAPGLHAVFAIVEGATIDTTGTTDMGGAHHWDLSGMLSGDHRVEVTTDAAQGQWFSADFPDATYVTKLSDASDLLGVFKATDTSLQLLGVVSPSDGSGKTELMYDPPVDTLVFPMTVGKTWRVDSNVTGLTMGLLSNFTEAYDSTADEAGEMNTPYGRFHVLRVRTVLTRTVGFVITVIRTDLWVTDCFGPVATIVSQNNEQNDEFTSAAEVRRLSP